MDDGRRPRVFRFVPLSLGTRQPRQRTEVVARVLDHLAKEFLDGSDNLAELESRARLRDFVREYVQEPLAATLRVDA